MTRAVGRKLAWFGLSAWIVLMIAMVGMKLTGMPMPWPIVLFPVWGPPAAYVAFNLASVVVGVALVVLLFLLRPWLR